jgi:hypothetical protein
MLSRRAFTISPALLALARRAGGGTLPPVRAITKPPGHHWFGYYDKLQFDPSGRYALGMSVDFEHRSPRADDVIRIGMVDTEDGDRWQELGQSRAWNWQQGSMLQWVPGSKEEVAWNDVEDGHFVARIKNVKSGKTRTLPAPFYTLSPDGKEAVAPVTAMRASPTRTKTSSCRRTPASGAST